MRRRIAAALALALLPAAGLADPPLRAQLEALRQSDLRVATIGYRIVTAAAPLCADRAAASGLVVGTAAQYREDMRGEASELLHLERGAAITGVVPGSVAARAGAEAGDRLIALNGRGLTVTAGPARRRASGDAYSALVDMLQAASAAGPVTLVVERGGRTLSLRFTGAPACATNFQMTLDTMLNAEADGKTVTVTARMVDFVPSDDELAFVLAHEFSHNMLGHRAQLHAHARSTADTEMEADYYGVHLMAMAGYDPAAAPRFWERMRGTRGIFWMPSGHLGDKRRIAFLQAAVDEIAAARARRGSLSPDYAGFMQSGR